MFNFDGKHLQFAKILTARGLKLAIAESCTGGLLSSRMTDISGASAYISANFVTYSNESKVQILGVSAQTLEKFGAVSEECAREMVQGLAQKTGCDIAICTTGIAGPTGGSAQKPVGTLYVGVCCDSQTTVRKFNLPPKTGRERMKKMFVKKALETALEKLDG